MSKVVGHSCRYCGSETSGLACDTCGTPGWFDVFAEQASYGWSAPALLALILHVILVIPLIAARPGPESAPSGSHGPALMTSITVIDSGTIERRARRLAPGPDVPEPDGVETLAKRASVPTRDMATATTPAVVDPPLPSAPSASPAQGPARGATLLPFDVLPIPTPTATPQPPVAKVAKRQRADVPPPAPKRPPARTPQVEELLPPMPPPAAVVEPAYLPPPAPRRRSRKEILWGIWCGVYVSCD